MWWLLGSLGLLSIEVSYLPQIVRLHRLKRADEVSLFFPSLNGLGRLFALAYSLHSHQPVFVAGFLAGLMLRCTLLVQVIYYRYVLPARAERARVPVRALMPVRVPVRLVAEAEAAE